MRFRLAWAVIVPAILAIALLLPQASYAIPVTGTLNLGGGVDVELSGTVSTIDFDPEDTGTGDFVVFPNSDGDFASLIATTGDILDLNDTDHPTGAPLSVEFLTFDADPDIVFTLNMILPGDFSSTDCFASPAAGQVCTPAATPAGGLSPFEFLNTSATSSVATFQVLATATRVSTGEATAYTGSFSATFDDLSYQAVLLTFLGGGEVQTGFDAEFTPGFVIPEPSTMNLVLGGLFVAVGVVSRRKLLGRKKA